MQRSAGILLPISSLPSPYGIGCFSQEAYDFVDWLKEAGQTYWQILPLGVTSYGDSPYQSFSAFAGNPYLIDLDLLPNCRCVLDLIYNPARTRLLLDAEERGIRIPEDISLLGYDNIAFAALPRIHLTTVSQHKFQQSRIAVERLLEKINGSDELTADLLEPELIIRSTCARKPFQSISIKEEFPHARTSQCGAATPGRAAGP